MHAFLIISKNEKTASDYANGLCGKEKIDPIDRDIQAYEKAMGIEEVRNIKKKILLKPFRGKTKAVIIQAYASITQEAQNALLKVLEEPPANTIIVIIASKKELFLPTIISRCKIVELKQDKINLADEDISKFNDLLDVLFNGKIGDKLKAAQDITKSKEETMLFLEKMSIFVRTRLIENYNDSKYFNLLSLLQKTHSVIKSTNVNQRIALENLFLSF